MKMTILLCGINSMTKLRCQVISVARKSIKFSEEFKEFSRSSNGFLNLKLGSLKLNIISQEISQDYFVGERLKNEIQREINFHPFLYCLEGKIMNIEGLKTRKIAMEEFYMSSKILSKQQRDNNLIKTNLEHLEKIKDCKMQTFQVIKDYLHSPLNILHSGLSQGLKIRRGL